MHDLDSYMPNLYAFLLWRDYMELKDYIEATSGMRIAMPQELVSATALETLISKISGINRAGCLPIDEPREGKTGFLVFYKEDGSEEEMVLELTRPYRERATVIVHDSYTDANAAYKDAVQKNYLIERADNPKQLAVGWIVVKGDGNEHHQLRIHKLKRG
jgi:hypothetical protein